MRVLLIDNRDSFTFNLAEACRVAGDQQAWAQQRKHVTPARPLDAERIVGDPRIDPKRGIDQKSRPGGARLQAGKVLLQLAAEVADPGIGDGGGQGGVAAAELRPGRAGAGAGRH